MLINPTTEKQMVQCKSLAEILHPIAMMFVSIAELVVENQYTIQLPQFGDVDGGGRLAGYQYRQDQQDRRRIKLN